MLTIAETFLSNFKIILAIRQHTDDPQIDLDNN
jgi:hypothetical protein